MTNNQLTRERIELIANFHRAMTLPPSHDEIEELARMALAAMDSEPVYQYQSGVYNDYNGETDWYWDDCDKGFYEQYAHDRRRILYRHAQPAPVVPEEAYSDDCQELYPSQPDSWAAGWHAWRAAMFQAGTLTNEDTKQAWTGIPDIDNAINMLDRIDTLESCDDDRVEAVKTVLRRLAGNSPVIPEGYVMVPKEPTQAMCAAFNDSDYGRKSLRERYVAMLAAAQQPQDEPQNIPEIIPGWIPVSERMPDDDDFVYIWPRPDFGVELHVGQYCECSPKGDGWYAQVYEQNYGIEWYPITVTHWMPLPAAPQEVQGD